MSSSFVISLAPEISSDVGRYGVTVDDIKSGYIVEGEVRDLFYNPEDGVFDDSAGIWSIEDDGVMIEYSLTVEKPHLFFEDSLIPISECTLGLATRLSSSDSRQLMIFKHDAVTITESSQKLTTCIRMDIPSGHLREKGRLELILYVKHVAEGSKLKSGTVMGTLWSADLLFSGDSSEFPITHESNPGSGLWRLDISYEDPRYDKFDQSVRLTFNDKHPRYKELELESDPFKKAAFVEVLSNAFSIIINKVLSEQSVANDIINGRNLEPGSLGEAVFFMITHYAKRYNDPAELMSDLNNHFWEEVRKR